MERLFEDDGFLDFREGRDKALVGFGKGKSDASARPPFPYGLNGGCGENQLSDPVELEDQEGWGVCAGREA